MTNQELFDKVVAHARKQKAKASDINGRCMYRTEDGKKCFIGALIPDEQYVSFLEYKFSGHPAVMEAAGLRLDQMPFADDLQFIHDTKNVDIWELEFQKLARCYGLIYTPTQEELASTI